MIRILVGPAILLALAACSSSGEAPVVGGLSPAERILARSGVPSHANVVYVLPDGREYAGGLTIIVTLGLETGDRVGFGGSAISTSGGDGIGVNWVLDDPQVLGELASRGLDATLEVPALPVAAGLAGGHVRAFRIRADPDGLFIGTFTVARLDADGIPDGETFEVQVHGRLSGGCEHVDAEGTSTTIADVTTEPLCNAVLGSF